MTIAILSDTHFGFRESRLVNCANKFSPGLPAYRKLKKEIFQFTKNRPLNFLVLNGDIMDFSICSINESITIAQPFFKQISKDKLADKIIYIPGNHDKQSWDGIQWDTNIIGNLSEYREPKPFTRIQSVWITPDGDVNLPGVKLKSKKEYGRIFLKGLFKKSDNNPRIILAYPNLYIKRKDKSTITVTHGHMFETAWVLLSDIFQGIMGLDEINTLKQLEEWNIPFTSSICTGVGSAGDVSKLFNRILHETYNNKTGLLSRLIDALYPRIRQLFDVPWYLRIIPKFMIKKIVFSLASEIKDPKSFTRYFDEDRRNAEHFEKYFELTKRKLENFGLPESDTVIFGHTHYPYPANDAYTTPVFPGLYFYNTGGWIKGNNAEVFLIDDMAFESFTV